MYTKTTSLDLSLSLCKFVSFHYYIDIDIYMLLTIMFCLSINRNELCDDNKIQITW